MIKVKAVASLLSVIVVVLSTVSCQSITQRAEIGMTVHFRGADAASIERQFDIMAEMDVRWVRVDVGWAWIERDYGQFDWSYPDRIVGEAADRGMNVLVVLAFTPPWARPSVPGHSGATPYHRPGRLSDFAKFARIAAERYAPRGVGSWEIWNEPNIRRFWPPRPDASEYSALFRAAAEAIRGVDRDATLLIGGLSPKYESSQAEIAPADYLEDLYDNGAAQLADAVAAHPYSFPAMPLANTERMIGEFRDLPDLHAVMKRRGDGRKKIWITEFGAPTRGRNSVSEKDQARSLVKARQQAARWDWAGPLIYYELVDGGNAAEDEDSFGVLREDLSPKPAATALIRAAS